MHRFWCLQLFIHVLLQFLTSLKLGHCSKLNWPKRVSAVYWLFGTLFYPCCRQQSSQARVTKVADMQVLIVILAQFFCRKTTHKCSLSLWTLSISLNVSAQQMYMMQSDPDLTSNFLLHGCQVKCLCIISHSSITLSLSFLPGSLHKSRGLRILTDRANSTPSISP